AATGVDYYDVGDFSSLARYRRLLRGAGLDVRLINGPTSQALALDGLRADVERLDEEARAWTDARLPGDLHEEVRGAALALVAELRERLARGPQPRCWWQR